MVLRKLFWITYYTVMYWRDPPYGGTTWLRYLAPKREFADSSLRWIPINGLAWSLKKCTTIGRTVCGASATKILLGTIREEKGISSQFWTQMFMQRVAPPKSETAADVTN